MSVYNCQRKYALRRRHHPAGQQQRGPSENLLCSEAYKKTKRLDMNVKKTKTMVIGKNEDIQAKIKVDLNMYNNLNV